MSALDRPRRLHQWLARFCFARGARGFACLAFAVICGAAEPGTNTTDLVVRFLEERLKQDPDDFLAAGKLGDTYLQQARESGRTDSHTKAEQWLRTALKWSPDSYPWRASLASALMAQHRFGEAAALAGKLTKENPESPAAYGVLGDALLEIGDVPGAESFYRKLAKLSSGLAVSARFAKLDWLRGNTAGALSNWSHALSFSNSSPESLAWAHVQKGELWFRMGKLTNAEVECQMALALVPDYYAALDHLAELRAGRGEFDRSRELFAQLAARTERPEYFQAVGDVLVAARRREEAKPWHDRALANYAAAAEKGSVAYFHHLASFYADVREDGATAEKWARRDLELRPSIYAWDALAWALFRKGDNAGALDAMKKALALGTKDAHLLAHAGSIFVRAGKISEGRDFMKQAENANPHYGDFHVHR
jgi:tetratricopeptide (TPR) repeat protein